LHVECIDLSRYFDKLSTLPNTLVSSHIPNRPGTSEVDELLASQGGICSTCALCSVIAEIARQLLSFHFVSQLFPLTWPKAML
jgi:hypothetical protein